MTHEKEIVGLVSSFDLPRLVENKRSVARNQPSRPRAGSGKRRREEERPAGEEGREPAQ